MPEKYMELLLCERFGWTIADLDESDGARVLEFLEMWQIETEVGQTKDATAAAIAARRR